MSSSESDFANNHPVHAVGIGLAAGALAKVAGAETTTALVVGGGTGAGAYWYMSTYGHTFPPGGTPAGPATGPATGVTAPHPPGKPTQPQHPVRPVGGLPAQAAAPRPPRPQPPRPQPRPQPRPAPGPPGILDIAMAPINAIGGIFSSIFG